MWNVASIKHDLPSEEISEFFAERWTDDVFEIELRNPGAKYDRVENYSCAINRELKELQDVKGKPLTVYGHGSFHHYTYGIVGNTMPQRTNEFLYIHIDYHTDAGIPTQKCNCQSAHGLYRCGLSLGCGSFVTTLKDHGANNLLFVGTDAHCGWKRKRGIKQEQLLQSDFQRVVEKQLKGKKIHDCYISMDLDVLRNEEIPTGYGRGKITLRHLLDILTVIKENKNIVGADILGLCRGDSGSHRDKSKKRGYYQPTGYLTYGIIAAHLTGKDYLDAMKIRDYFMSLDKNHMNGVEWTEMAEGLTL
jgi:arginase family enzyme